MGSKVDKLLFGIYESDVDSVLEGSILTAEQKQQVYDAVKYMDFSDIYDYITDVAYGMVDEGEDIYNEDDESYSEYWES